MPDECAISCIVVSYNCIEPLKNCLVSLKNQKDIRKEIIVVDNHSSDGTPGFLRGSGVTALLQSSNLGFGKAVNLGASRAAGKYLFIVNPDTESPPSTLNMLYRFAESSTDAGLVAPVLQHPDGKTQLSARTLPRRIDFIKGRGSMLFKWGITGEKHAGYIVPDRHTPIEIPSVSATAVLIRRDLYLSLGGFDPRFFLYLEDVDLCRRIREAGFKIMLMPQVIVRHQWRRSSGKRPYFSNYHHHLSVWKYFRKHYPDQWFYNISLMLALAGGLILSTISIAARKVNFA